MHNFHTVQFVPTATAAKHQTETSFQTCGCFVPSRYFPQFKSFQLEQDDFNRILKKANTILMNYQELIDKEAILMSPINSPTTSHVHSTSDRDLDDKQLTNSDKLKEMNRKKILLILAIVSLVPTFGISLMIYKLWPKIIKKKHEQRIIKLREKCKAELIDLIQNENLNMKKYEIQMELTFGPLKYPIYEESIEEEMTEEKRDEMEMMDEEENEKNHKLNQTEEDYNDGSYILKRNKSELTKSQVLGFFKKKNGSSHVSNNHPNVSTSTTQQDNLPIISIQSSKKRILDIFQEECIPSIKFITDNRKSAYLMDFIRNTQRNSTTPSTPVAMFKRNFSDVEQLAGSVESQNPFFPSELKNYHFDYNNFHPLNPNYQKI
ncbi:predicted protein [Naegleria gruberi]|uniref:Predicted protein n=1 Tax=Naegleria gruberi TaxID=5762 RepID=D2V7K2_NAEGR|nr:uncharacterized protein NAEGRDRAFT_64832 [Naegleria gruberi]EFC47394.1 predicted protein [Naegleria gruberi]|eukprot:XP_002680138.1 predicted protein [Naegleria gruberi strain NEG-M]